MKRNIHPNFLILLLAGTLISSNLDAQIVLQRCDVDNRWNGSNEINTSSADKKEGIASISFTGSGTEWFSKSFSQTDVGVDESGWFTFWLYVSDVSQFIGDGQVELTSSGGPDTDEYAWDVSSLGLSNGWNHVKLQISDATKTGSPDLQAISYFRIYQELSGEITARLDDLRFTLTETPVAPEPDPLAIDTPDFTTLDGKVMFGYQGWFSHPDDSSELARWRHWGTLQDGSTLGVDMFPDMREHEADERYETGLTFEDGRPATIYSAYNRKTVMRHMKWLRDYDLDGVFLQRFNVSTRDGRLRAFRDTVTVNVMLGCEKYDRAFVNMYDLSGYGGGNIDDLIEDWKHMVDDLGILESPNYLWHRGKPLISLWGFTVRDDLPVSDLEQVIDFFKNSPDEKYRASIMLGTNDDFFNRSSWTEQLSRVDVISPWAVGRFNNESGNNNFINNRVKPGQDWCDEHNVDFLPVVWPGFSWYNLKREGTWQQNQIPRRGGDFFWTQATRVVSANAKSVYIAMFDEVDEATAMYKLSETEADVPAQGYWLTLDADGFDLPSDWYLRCAKQLNHVVKGKMENTTDLGTPSDGIDDFSVEVQSTRCGITDGKLIFHFPQVHADSLLEFSIDGGNTYAYTTTEGSVSLETGNLSPGTYNVWVRRTDGSFPTDLGPYTIFEFYPDVQVVPGITTCGFAEGELTILLGNIPYYGPVEISVDGGDTYVLTTEDGTWDYTIGGLAEGEYQVWARWENGDCPYEVGTYTIESEPQPVTLYYSVDEGAFEKAEGIAVYGCPGYSLDVYAEPAEDSWEWTWSGDLDYQATGRSVRITDKMTSEMTGKYYVSYIDEENTCIVEEQLFYVWKGDDCPVGIGTRETGVSVYPNPTGGLVRLSATGVRINSIEIKDVSGRVIRVLEGQADDEVTIDISGYEKGTYLYSVTGSGNESFHGAIVKE